MKKSQWSSYLRKSENNKYSDFKDTIKLKIEILVNEIKNNLLKNKEYNNEIALKTSISLLMEQLLELQYENNKLLQKDMIVSLIMELDYTEKEKEIILNLLITEEFLKKKIKSLSLKEKIKIMIGR